MSNTSSALHDDTSRPSISAIDAASIHRICANQVVVDLTTAVKELIENSRDAKATSITITFTNFGTAAIEVSDNGVGVPQSQYAHIAAAHATSKLRSFADLNELSSFGFRGEALNSLAALSALTITTRCASDAVGAALTFDRSGQVISQTPTPRNVGTTVRVCELFSTLPVRHNALIQHCKREYGRAVDTITAYALISTNVRFQVVHNHKHQRIVVLTTPNTDDQVQLISAVYGSKQAAALIPIDMTVNDRFRVVGCISRHDDTSGRSSNDRQLIYVNGRPIDFPTLLRLINETYRSLALQSSYPFIMLDLRLPTTSYDINITPNKRTVMLHDEALLLAAIKDKLADIWTQNQRSFIVKQTQQDSLPLHKSASVPLHRFERIQSQTEQTSSRSMSLPTNLRVQSADSSIIMPMQVAPNKPALVQTQLPSTHQVISHTHIPTPTVRPSVPLFEFQRSHNESRQLTDTPITTTRSSAHTSSVNSRVTGPSSATTPLKSKTLHSDDTPARTLNRPQRISQENETKMLECDWTLLESQWRRLQERDLLKTANDHPTMSTSSPQQIDSDSSLNALGGVALVTNAVADDVIQRTISKEDFASMTVIGQFNLGFIIARLHNDLYIIDQHAADEKYRYEVITRDTIIESQRLLTPLAVDVSGEYEQIIRSHREVFTANGFDCDISSDNRITLRALPVTRKRQFDVNDLLELCHEMSQTAAISSNALATVRLPRLRHIFASRACRSAVMIGDGLKHNQMQNIIWRMASMTSPWSCPHGRPTMRHLADIKALSLAIKKH